MKIPPIYYDCPSTIALTSSLGLLYVTNGEGVLIVKGTEPVEVKKNRVFLLKQELEISFLGNLLAGHLLEFEHALLDHYLLQHTVQRNIGLFEQALLLPYADLEKNAEYFFLNQLSQLAAELENRTPLPVIKPYLFLLLWHANRSVSRLFVMVPDEERLIIKLMGLIELNYKINRVTAFYASGMGMTPRNLNAFTQKVFAKRFFVLLMDRILAEADLLLQQNMFSVKVIAYELGFMNQSHFSTYYIRYRGFPPREVRRG